MTVSLQRFCSDNRAVVSVIVALALFPVGGAVVGSVSLGMQAIDQSGVRSVVATACSRVTSSVHLRSPGHVRERAAQAVLDRQLPLTALDMSNAAYAVTDTRDGLIINVDGSIPSLTPGILGDGHISIAVNCDGGAAPASGAGTVLFYEGFERPSVLESGHYRWYVEPNLPDWLLIEGPGTQMVRPDTSETILAYEGSQFGELDSDTARGAILAPTTNSSIARTIPLSPGSYRLSYYYHPHPAASSPADQEVAVYIDPATGPGGYSNQVQSSSTGSGWTRKQVDFDVDCSSDFRFSFAAKGDPNRAGGYIDAIKLEALAIGGTMGGGGGASCNAVNVVAAN